MASTLLIVGGVLVALVALLALIVALSSRPATRGRGSTDRGGIPGWVVDSGQQHPDAWAPLSQTSTQIRALR